jgi:hypothetical protein
MNSTSENKSQKNSAVSSLTRRNAAAVREIQLTEYQPIVYAIPKEQREMEQQLLMDAAAFQPILYRQIETLATREELVDQLTQFENRQNRYLTITVEGMQNANGKLLESVRQTVSQDGKAREAFISGCSSELEQSRQRIEHTIAGMRRKILWLMAGTSLGAVALSVLACAVFWKLAA